MSEVKYNFIGWNNTEGHDKVWISFQVENELYCAWGRRGGRLSFKDHGSKTGFHSNKLLTLQRQKENKGYKEVDEFLLFSIFPNFKDELEQELMLKLLAGTVK